MSDTRHHRPPRHGVARVMSRRGLCSRSEAARLVAAGRVHVDGKAVRNPEQSVDGERAIIRIDGIDRADAPRRYLMLNKPRGLVTTVTDERGRDTVYRCFDAARRDSNDWGWLAPVGRLDKASEGLLLFSNDPAWAARVTDPSTGPSKAYHVQVDAIPSAAQLAALVSGVDVDGTWLQSAAASVIRAGGKRAWLEVVLEEGRNRQIRRLLAALDLGVLRLVRVSIGGLALGTLAKGEWRELTHEEVDALASTDR